MSSIAASKKHRGRNLSRLGRLTEDEASGRAKSIHGNQNGRPVNCLGRRTITGKQIDGSEKSGYNIKSIQQGEVFPKRGLMAQTTAGSAADSKEGETGTKDRELGGRSRPIDGEKPALGQVRWTV